VADDRSAESRQAFHDNSEVRRAGRSWLEMSPAFPLRVSLGPALDRSKSMSSGHRSRFCQPNLPWKDQRPRIAPGRHSRIALRCWSFEAS